MNETEEAQTARIERYLLGDLPDAEIRELERRLLEHPDQFTQVETMEDELVDRYVREELSGPDRARFEERLLPSGRIRRRVTFARSLHRLAEERAARQTSPRGADGIDGADGFIPFPVAERTVGEPRRSFSSRLAWAACLVALVGAGALALVDLRLQDHLLHAERAHQSASARAVAAEKQVAELSETVESARADAGENEGLRRQVAESRDRIAALEKTVHEAGGSSTGRIDPSAQPDRSDRSAGLERKLLFLALATRGGGHPTSLELPAPGGVELQLDLDRLHPEATLTVTIRRGGTPIWRQTGLSPILAGADGMLPVDLPEPILLPGTYRIEVLESTGEDADPIAVYDFVVTR